MWQANWVAGELRRLGVEIELIEVTTSGDLQQSGPIAALGQQGLFTKEIQAAVLDGRADMAVHSLKDLPTDTTEGLVLAAVPRREVVADALVTSRAATLVELPAGSRIGTGSLRRQAQIKHLRPDVEVVGIRGNVDTRLRKLDRGDYDAVILAAAGLRRLGLGERISELLEPPRVLPAPGQGALGIECREAADEVRELLARLDDRESHRSIQAERAMLAKLHGGCSAPIGAWARIAEGRLVLDGVVATLDGTRVLRANAEGPPRSGTELGEKVAQQLLDQGAAEIVSAARGG